jgi:flagellar hook-associated protein 2
MPGFSIDGLISGLDTTSLVASLMQAEALPQTQLKTKVTDNKAVISAYQTVNSTYASLKASADSLALASTWTTPTVRSSSTGVAASATTATTVGQLSFDVTAVAAAHSLATADFSTFSEINPTVPPILTFAKGTGAPVKIYPADGDLATVVKSINDAAGLGVTAVAIQVSAGHYRIQLTAKDTGADNVFTVEGLGADLKAPTIVQPGTDASINLGGTLNVSRPTNTFSDVLPGVSFTVSKIEDGVTVSAAVDPGSLADKVQAFVDSTNASLSEISRQSSYDATNKVGGPLLSDSSVRELQAATLSNMSAPVALTGPPATSWSPALVGIQTDRTGKVTFDRAAFLALQAADPAKAQALVQGVAAGAAAIASGATDKTTGTLTLAVQGRDAVVKDLNTRIDAWDLTLVTRQATLKKTFDSMELALSKMKSQSSWLAGQISAMPATYAG